MLPEQLVSTVHRSPVECFVYQMSAFSTCVMVRPRTSAYQVTSVVFRHSSCLLLNKQIMTVGARCLSRSLSVFLSHNTQHTTHNPHNTHTYIPRHTRTIHAHMHPRPMDSGKEMDTSTYECTYICVPERRYVWVKERSGSFHGCAPENKRRTLNSFKIPSRMINLFPCFWTSSRKAKQKVQHQVTPNKCDFPRIKL